jgi:ribose/xylose/arabinose/galactoside ABC-type transport system permease subunit
VKRLWQIRELSTVAILVAEVAFFAWYLWPEAGRSHPFLNLPNALLILKYSSIYGIAAIGASIVIISGGIDLAPGAVIALSSVVVGGLFVEGGWSLQGAATMALLTGAACGLLASGLIVLVRLPPFIATLGVMGIARGLAFILTEGRFYDVSGRLPAGWTLAGLPVDWVAPVVMVVLAAAFQIVLRRFQWLTPFAIYMRTSDFI